jgi:hypothetical protein
VSETWRAVGDDAQRDQVQRLSKPPRVIVFAGQVMDLLRQLRRPPTPGRSAMHARPALPD